MTTTVNYCHTHPRQETSLRCNRCEQFICTQCAIHTPTGYHCKSCVRSQQKSFETAQWYDYIVAGIVAGLLSYLGAQIATRFGFFLILLAPVIGTGIAEAVRFTTGKRRSKLLSYITVIAMIGGGLPLLLGRLFLLFSLISQVPAIGFSSLIDIILIGVYLGIATPVAFYRIRGLYL